MDMAEKDYSEMRHASGCSCCGAHHVEPSNDMTRRNFVKVTGTGALGAAVMPGITWAALAGRENGDRTAPGRRTLIVKPVLTCDVPVRQIGRAHV